MCDINMKHTRIRPLILRTTAKVKIVTLNLAPCTGRQSRPRVSPHKAMASKGMSLAPRMKVAERNATPALNRKTRPLAPRLTTK